MQYLISLPKVPTQMCKGWKVVNLIEIDSFMVTVTPVQWDEESDFTSGAMP